MDTKASEIRPLDAPSSFGKLFDTPVLLLVLATLFWSGNFVLGRAVRLDVPPVGLAFWRWFGGSLLLIGFAWPYLKRDRAIMVRHWKIITVLAILGVTTFNTLVYTGLQYTTALNALLMQSSMPVVIVLMSFLFFRERVTGVQAVGISLSLIGALAIVAQGSLAVLLGLSLNWGDVLIMVAVFSYAAYSSLLRRRPGLHPLSFLAVTFIVGTLFLTPFYLWETLSGRVMHFDTVTTLSVLYVAIFPSILSYLFFNRGVELIGANQAGLFIHLMPIFGSLMAMVFLGERLHWFHGLGIVLIVSGIYLATRLKR
ncbi:MAG: DMT family transporter [Anaerolineae bacterium]|nr:DMT family transporter [Anaerolineae bacterium]MCB0225368.1 DMT family transporter [Anaerolineae bacterium]MCB9108498.1 DMT family transporter [Anaerolineales bacterium]